MTEDKCDQNDFATFSRSDQEPTDDSLIVCPKIEGYTLGEQLGVGGMGVVWRAIQLSTNREIALKVTNAAVFGSKKAMARFEREVELAARLEHPNVARVYDSGIHQNVYYYAMELIEGVPLDQYVLKHALNAKQIVRLVHTLCKAMQYAHQRGVIHRDLKPSNILVTRDGQPHILDFGLAKDLLSDQSKQTVSLDGDVLGTPAYMSPEQASGKLDEIDTRSDVYSLGVITYVLLTQQWPYDVEGAHFEVLQTIREQQAIRPTVVSSTIDKDLEAILLKLLEKEPDQRYQSMTDLIDDLHNWLQGLPVKARIANNWYLLKKLILRHRVQATVILLLLVIILATGSIGIFSLNQVSLAKKVVQKQQKHDPQKIADTRALIDGTAFGIFLERWYENDPRAQAIQAYLPQGSREYCAVDFLMDPRPLADKTDDPRYALDSDESFWQFILAEQHQRDGSLAEARKAYIQCMQDSGDTETWWRPLARLRLKQLESE